MQKSIRIIVLLIGVALHNHVFAQATDSLSTYQHDEAIVVTATRSAKKASAVSRSLSVISKQDIDKGIYISAMDILSQQQGMSFIGGGQSPGSAQSLFMRGVNANSTAVLIDGLRIRDPSSIDNSLNFSEMSLTNIDQIEILRGAHSTLYGSSAIGGVINFITRKNRAIGFNADFSAQLGTFGEGTALFNQDLFLNYTFSNGFYINGEIFNSHVAGIDASVDIIPDSLKFKNPDREKFSKLESLFKVGFTNTVWDVFFNYKTSAQKADIDDGAFLDDDNAYLRYNRDLLTLGLVYNYNDHISYILNSGMSEMRRRAIDDSSLVDNIGNYDQTYTRNNYNGEIYNNEFQVSLKYEHLNLLVGAGIEDENMTSDSYIYSNSSWGLYQAETNLDSLNLETSTVSFFGHIDLNGALFDKDYNNFNLALGARSTDHSSFGNTYTYEINPSIKFASILLYGSLSTGFNAPSLFRLYTPESHYLSGITRGNPNLKPEKSFSLELGIKHSISEDLNLFVSIFRNEIKDVHEWVYLWDNQVAIADLGNDFLRDDSRGDTYINAGIMTTSGFEVGFSSNITQEFRLSGNASWLAGKQSYSPGDLDIKQTQGNHVQVYNNGSFITKDVEVDGLARRSGTINLSMSYSPWQEFSVISDIHHVGERDDVFYNPAAGPYGSLDTAPVGNYTLINLSGRYQILENVQLNLKVENVLDREYSEIRGYNTRGRGFYLGLRYSIQ